MNLLTFWILATYLLGYGAFFVTIFPVSERILANGDPYNARTYWSSLFWATVLSLVWPWFLVLYAWRHHARS